MFELLQPLHPKLVHFPIALFMTALFFEVMSHAVRKDFFHQCAMSLYVFAALVTPVVVLTGTWAAKASGLHHPVLDEHRLYAFWTMGVSLVSLPILWLLVKKNPKGARMFFVVCLIALAILVTLTGHEGGEMVFEYGVGTKLF